MVGLISDPNAIVSVRVATILAAMPPNYQQTGCLISFGGTTILPNTTKFLSTFADLSALLQPPSGIVSATWEPNDDGPPVVPAHVLVETTNPLPDYCVAGAIVKIQMTRYTPAAYNGIYDAEIIDSTHFKYDMLVDPGADANPASGGMQIYSSLQLNAQASTFFRQGTGSGVYILELGYQPTFLEEIAAIETWLNNNPLSFYGYLLPDYFGTQANIPIVLPLFQQFTDPEGMTYFWVTIEAQARGLITKATKSVFQLAEAPGVKEARDASGHGVYTEFTLAGVFYWAMQYKPTSVTRVAPMCFKYVYGVTPFPTIGNGPLLIDFKANCVNYIQTGAQGGVNFTDVYQGVTTDGFDYFNWWWTIDWVQINISIDLANAVINGTNNPLAPLYYDQPGINQLQAVLAGTMTRGGSFGMINGKVVQTELTSPDLAAAIAAGTYAGQCNVNAVPFLPYSIQNPGDYGIGEYDGLSTLFIPARGFVHILVSVVATDIVSL